MAVFNTNIKRRQLDPDKKLKKLFTCKILLSVRFEVYLWI